MPREGVPNSDRRDCVCCGFPVEPRDPDPWEGRLDDYCHDCALSRCDAYPGFCPNEGRIYSAYIEQVIAEGLIRADSVLVVDMGPNDAESWDRFILAARAVLKRLDQASLCVSDKVPQSTTGSSSHTIHVALDETQAERKAT